jgi:hypothetical protein
MNTAQEMLSDYFFNEARWRWEKAGEYPDDARNAASAQALANLAAWVRELPDEDPDVRALAWLHHGWYGVDGLLPGEEAARLASRYGFGGSVESPESFLHTFVDAIVSELAAEMEDHE